MIKRFINWLRSKLQIVKPGIDIEVIGSVAIIRVDCGHMPRAKAEEYARSQIELFDSEVKAAIGVSKLIIVPYFKG